MRQPPIFTLAPASGEPGSLVWTNWIAWTEERSYADGDGLVRESDADTYAMYSDATVSGSFAIGPISVTGILPTSRARRWPGLAARVAVELTLRHRERRYYHNPAIETGRSLDGELADLLSLALGVRCETGGLANRTTRGRRRRDLPALPGDKPKYALIPDALAKKTTASDAAALLELVPNLTGTQSVALARAARAYSAGMWYAEYDPEIGFLWLARAVEAAAQSERVPDAIGLFREQKPRVALCLAADPVLLAEEAESYARTAKATAKFRKFLVDGCPEPPPRGGSSEDRVGLITWSRRARFVDDLYAYRSRAFHEGAPLPPVLYSRVAAQRSRRIESVPKVYADYGDPNDRIMTLWVFEYMVRNALQGWWRRMAAARRAI